MNLTVLSTFLGLFLAFAHIPLECNAGIITVMIGDDDGFGGAQGANSNPGDPFGVFNSPSIAPGTYLNDAGLDVTTVAPWTPYVFQFSFVYDATSLTNITSATVTIQSGSIGRRTDNSGFGFASVSADGGFGPTSLGHFWATSTGGAGSAPEETVKAHVFDVSALITPSLGNLTLRIDGSLLINPVDQFSLDFAHLSIDGPTAAVPEPSSIALLGIGVFLIAGRAMRRRLTRSTTAP